MKFAEVWNATFVTARRDLPITLSIAAAFVLLPTIAVALFGPPQPVRLSQMTPGALLPQLAVAVVAAIAQLAIARLTLLGGTVAEALRAAVPRLLWLLVSILLSSLALVPALALLQATQLGHPGLAGPALAAFVPGLYVVARLSLALPLIAGGSPGPVTALRLSWRATAGNGWRVLLLLAALLVLLLAASVLGAAVASAVGSVLILAGGKALAGFVVALVSAVAASLYTLANSVMLAEICRRLARS